MDYIDHDILYSDNGFSAEWRRLVERANNEQDSFWRHYARRKLRRSVKELLRGIRPRVIAAGSI
jgi:hypothetical protein